MPKSSDGPGDSPPGGPPSGNNSGTGLCCACPANGTVDTVGDTKYFSCDYNPGWNIRNKCTIAIQRTATEGSVTIKKTYNLAYSNGATEADDKATVVAAIASSMSTWTSEAAKWRVEVKQPGCDTQLLSITYTAPLVASGGDIRVTADKTVAAGLRSYVEEGTKMTFYLNGVGNVNWTMAHEMGHTFGLVDMYTYDRTAATPAPVCTWKGADNPDSSVTLTTSSITPDPGKFGFDAATVMGKNGNTTYPEYLFYWVAIEVKRILAANGANAEVRIVAKP